MLKLESSPSHPESFKIRPEDTKTQSSQCVKTSLSHVGCVWLCEGSDQARPNMYRQHNISAALQGKAYSPFYQGSLI